MTNTKNRRSAYMHAWALLRTGSSAPTAFPCLIGSLKDMWWIRVAAARALADLGPAAKTAIPALTDLLQDSHMYVRIAAAEALEKIKGEKNRDASGQRSNRLARKTSLLVRCARGY